MGSTCSSSSQQHRRKMFELDESLEKKVCRVPGPRSQTVLGRFQNAEIERELKRETKLSVLTVKILLLGASDSGKSTIAKQMRILHLSGFSKADKMHYKFVVLSNYMDAFGHIAKGIRQLDIPVPPLEEELVQMFEHSYAGQFHGLLCARWEQWLATAAQFLDFCSVKGSLLRTTEFYVPDSIDYFLANSKRILRADYSPTTEDIIHARTPTKGVYETVFAFRQFTIRLIDVGGQTTERRKWIHCFEDVSAVLFVVSLSCYNLVMEEDGKTNQLADSVSLFKAIFHNKFLRGAPFIAFLNKRDLLERKLARIPLQHHFSEFGRRIHAEMDNEEMFGAAVEFIKALLTKASGNSTRRPFYQHVTNATDTRHIDFVFNDTCSIVVKKNLKESAID